jgi:hypothetical protein
MTAPNADSQAVNIEQGSDPTNPTGFVQGWFSRIRARKVKGDNINKAPFTRSWGTTSVVASPMEQDKVTATADATGFRYVDSTNDVLDVGDMIVVAWEYFLLKADPATLKQALVNASTLRNWPAGYTGNAPFDKP